MHTYIHTYIHSYIQWHPATWLPLAHSKITANERFGRLFSALIWKDGRVAVDYMVDFVLDEGQEP